MSGPVTEEDIGDRAGGARPTPAPVEMSESRETEVGGLRVRRALPRGGRRTVGAWCFVDHMGPAQVDEDGGLGVAPHPHIGLQTVTWLIAGEAVHRDSLGSEQVLRPGQLNLMTAGAGVSHSEERTGRYRGELQGAQLWVAQPATTRFGEAAFEHHGELPRVDLGGGATTTVLVGALEGSVSPARRDTDHVGVDLALVPGSVLIPLRPTFEYALVVLTGSVLVEGVVAAPGHLAYLGAGRDELRLTATETTRALLLGGLPFESSVVMWWNFVARTQQEITDAYLDWTSRSARFGTVRSVLPRTEVGPPPWYHSS